MTRRTNFNYFHSFSQQRRDEVTLRYDFIISHLAATKKGSMLLLLFASPIKGAHKLIRTASHSEGLSGFYGSCLWLFSTFAKENQFAKHIPAKATACDDDDTYAIKPSTPL